MGVQQVAVRRREVLVPGKRLVEVTSDTGLEWGAYRAEAAGFFGLDWSVKEGEFVFGSQ